MVLGFGLGALGGADFYNPTRKAMPTSDPIQSDHELTNEHGDWVRGMQAQIDRMQRRDLVEEAAWQAHARTDAQIPDGGYGLDYWRDAALRSQGEGGLAGYGGPREGNLEGWFGDLDGKIRAHEASIGQLRNQLEAGNLSFDRKLEGRHENQLRQQQAYDWMQGANQENALMSPDYAKAGFNTITGLTNPYAGPEGSGASMDWASGVYDPNTQSGTGTYQPSWQRTNFGW